MKSRGLINKIITIYVPGNVCNLSCSYCYVNAFTQGKNNHVELKYQLKTMIAAFSPERLGGCASITVIGEAETLLTDSIVPFIHGLIHYGHIVTVVTNGTITNKIKELVDCDNDDKKNLIVKCSLHWNQLKKKGLLDCYFDNLRFIKNEGVSFYPFIVLSNEYLNEMDEISKRCRQELGNTPHCSPCSKIRNSDSVLNTSIFKFEPECTDAFVKRVRDVFDSDVFEEILKNYKMMNPQEHFCYAGMWSFGVWYDTGSVFSCHGTKPWNTSFYQNIDKKFVCDKPVAYSCGIASCSLQYDFFSLGLIPEYKSMLFGDMIFKKGFISEYLRDRLNIRFDEQNEGLSTNERMLWTVKNKNEQIKLAMERYHTDNPFFNEAIYKRIAEGKKIVIYGTGNVYKKYKYTIGFHIEFFLDSSAKVGELFENKSIYKPETIENWNPYFVVIATNDNNRILIEEKLEAIGLKYAFDYV